MWNGEMRSLLSLEELLTLFMSVLYGVASVLVVNRGQTTALVAMNASIVLAIVCAAWSSRLTHSPLLALVRDWYVVLFLIVIYLENRTLIPLVNPRVYDDLVMAADRRLFAGHDPTVLVETIMHPALTEVLQLVYASFYLMPLSLCAILYVSRRKAVFHVCASTILMGFYASYIGYYMMPVAGPRYFMDGFHTKNLVGLWAFEFVRATLDAAEGMMYDCMPSGHTLVSVLTTLLAFRYARAFAGPATVWTAALVFSTVYLRYHYVSDLLAGAVLGVLVFLAGPLLAARYLLGAGGRMVVTRAAKMGEEGT